jgi:4-hydroxy-tetrahydrodipicolinate synthase
MQVYSLDLGHGVTPSPAEIERYLHDVLSNVDVPAIISTHFLSGYTIPIDVLEHVVGRYNITGINCTVPDLPGMPYLVNLVELFGDELEIHVGGPMQALTAMALGATGYLSSEGNLVPKLCTAVTTHYNRREFEESHEAYSLLMRLFAANRYSGIKGIKAALEILNLPGGPPRAPRLPVSDDEHSDIAAALRQLNVEQLL